MAEDRHPRQKSAALRAPTAFERYNSRDTESLHTKASVSKQVLTSGTPPSAPRPLAAKKPSLVPLCLSFVPLLSCFLALFLLPVWQEHLGGSFPFLSVSH